MTSHGQRRPVTSREFNRLLFALILLASLAVLARLVTRQESQAANAGSGEITAAEWVRTADALFLRAEWEMAADAYLGAIEAARTHAVDLDFKIYRKLAESLRECHEYRAAVHFLRTYRMHLGELSSRRVLVNYATEDESLSGDRLTAEIDAVDAMLARWSQTR